MLSNREWASAAWLSFLLLFALRKQEVRSSLHQVFHNFFKPIILLPFASFFVSVALEVWLASVFGLWNKGLAISTLLWAATCGVAMFFRYQEVSDNANFFKQAVRKTIGISVLLEFIINMESMSLIAELFLAPVVAAFVLNSSAVDLHQVKASIKRFSDTVLGAIAVLLIGFSAWRTYGKWSETDRPQLLLQFALPIWLTIGALPYMYLFNLYIGYDTAFRAINSATTDSRARWRARLAVLTKLHVKNRTLHEFAWFRFTKLASASTISAARRMIADFEEERVAKARRAIDEQERLRKYAGVDGVDANGRRLDRREFRETVKALDWLETCQMGWYRNRGERYRPELIDLFSDDFTAQGLPKNSGITMRVSDDGQAWYAWRRTVTGWCFAIGAAGPPPDRWEYDGPDPPEDFPGRDARWGDVAFSDEVNLNWWNF